MSRSSAQDGPVRLAQLLTDLQHLGFSEYEGRTYVALVSNSPATAYEISKSSGIPRSNTYGALENLTLKGAVQPVSDNPVRYVPIEPAVLLSRLAREVREACDRLGKGLVSLKSGPRRDYVWTVTGEGAVHGKVEELIESARLHIWIKASDQVIRPHLPALRQAVARGVKLLIILFGLDTKPFELGPDCRVYLHEGNGVRMGGADNLFTVAADYRIALMASLAGDVVGAHTTSEPIVRMAETLIRHDVYIAEMFARFGKQIEAAFGPHLLKLRRETFSPEQLSYLERNLASRDEASPGPATAPTMRATSLSLLKPRRPATRPARRRGR